MVSHSHERGNYGLQVALMVFEGHERSEKEGPMRKKIHECEMSGKSLFLHVFLVLCLHDLKKKSDRYEMYNG